MKRAILVASLFALAMFGGPTFAQAHHRGHGGHGHGGHGLSLGLHFGVPFAWYDPYYYYPPPYYPPAVAAPAAPPVYVERSDGPSDPQQNWWYYCEQSRAYYPYVKSCRGGWQRVSPAPPAR